MPSCGCGCGGDAAPGKTYIRYHHPRRPRLKFWEEYPPPVPDGDCLRWRGPHHSQGYGLCGEVSNGSQYAHRVAWMRAHGPIPESLEIDHVKARGCRFRDCVNPAHLEPVTQRENLLRAEIGGDWGQAAKTHCPQGHEYTEDNTYRYARKDGTSERHCKACRTAHKRAYRARRASKF